MNENPRFSNPAKQRVVSWILFLAGVLLLCIARYYFKSISIPLLLTSFVLSIILLRKKKIWLGIILFLLTLFVPYLIQTVQDDNGYEDFMRNLEMTTVTEYWQKKSNIRIENVRLENDSEGRTYIQGTVRNMSDTLVFKNVKIQVEGLDYFSNVVETSFTYVPMENEELRPNEEKSFKDFVSFDNQVVKVRCEIFKEF